MLGSGLGGFVDAIQVDIKIPYREIPHFAASTAMGHAGQLVCGTTSGVPVVAMQGRIHLYEGNTAQQATLPIRVLHRLGIELLLLSNAVGGLNPAYRLGDIMLVDDQINLMFQNPLIGVNDDNHGPRFPDMSQPYDRRWIERCHQIARQKNIRLHQGVYAALSGPTYETRAEYRMLRRLGADVVGMSTAPEAIVAAQAGVAVLAMSVVTNVCRPDAPTATSGEDVIVTAASAEPRFQAIALEVIKEVAQGPRENSGGRPLPD